MQWDGIGNAHPEGQLGTGDARSDNSNYTSSLYHDTGGTATEKGLADTADRENFGRYSLPAASKGNASTNPRAEYDVELAGSTSQRVSQVWETVSYLSSACAASLIQRLEADPSAAARFGAKGNLRDALFAGLYGSYGRRHEVSEELIAKGVVAFQNGLLVVLEDDAAIGRPKGRFSTQVRGCVRDAVVARDGLTCQLCGQPIVDGKVDLDHIKPVASGGRSTVDNLRVTHPSCNRARSPLARKRSGRRPRDKQEAR